MKARILSLVTALSLCGVLLAGCSSSTDTGDSGAISSGDSSTSSSDSATSSPSGSTGETTIIDVSEISEEDKYGGVLVMALSAIASNIDPIKYTSVYENQIIASIADTLVVYNNELSEFMPNLATDWSANEAGDVYTFNLRDDVYFHEGTYQDGRLMTAEDVKYSLERSATQSALGRLDMLDHCVVLDDFTIECHLTGPNASFMAALVNGGNVIIPQEEVEGWGDDFGAHFVGTGPFALKEGGWIVDTSCELVRSENYWGQTPYLDGVKYVYIVDVNMRVSALQTGEVHIANDLAGESILTVQNDSNLDMVQIPGMGVNYIYFNQVNGPTADIKVREALIMAVDIDAMCSALYQYNDGTRGYLALPPASWGYDESLESIVPEYDPEGAKALLAEAGYPDGFTLEYHTSDSATSKLVAEIFQQFMAQIGVTVKINQSAWGTFSEIGASGNADVISMSWTWDPDPFFYLNKMFHSSMIGSLGNGQGFNVPEVDALLDEAVTLSDQGERAALYKEALALITEQYAQLDYGLANVNVGMSNLVQDYPVRADKTINIADASTTNTWLVQE